MTVAAVTVAEGLVVVRSEAEATATAATAAAATATEAGATEAGVTEAVTVAEATAEAMAEVTAAVAKAVETEVDCTPPAPRSHRTMLCHSIPTTWRSARGMWCPSQP